MRLTLDQTHIENICHPFFNDIQENKFQVFLTHGGNVAVVLNRKAGGEASMLGAYYTGTNETNGEWIATKWAKDGTYPSINEKLRSTKLDLRMGDTTATETA